MNKNVQDSKANILPIHINIFLNGGWNEFSLKIITGIYSDG